MPGLAERIVAMAEGNHADRLSTNKAARFVAVIGPLLAFVVAMTMVVGGFLLIYVGRSLEGIGAIGSAIGAVLWAFLASRRK